jgi:hypothetical protein
VSEFNYHNRIFRGVVNYDDGDLSGDIRFHYSQEGSEVRGKIQGGRVQSGQILAEVLPDGRLDMIWQYRNTDGEIICGTCVSTPEILADGRYRLHEVWTITKGPNTGLEGISVIEEVETKDN